MDDNNRNVRHPFLAALKMFEVAARSAFDTAAAFWRPSGKREKQEAAAKQQQSNAPSEQARQPIKQRIVPFNVPSAGWVMLLPKRNYCQPPNQLMSALGH